PRAVVDREARLRRGRSAHRAVGGSGSLSDQRRARPRDPGERPRHRSVRRRRAECEHRRRARRPPALCCYNAFSSTGPDGRYTVYVRAGAYRINFQPPDATDYVLEYWNDKPNRDAADLLTVAGPTTGIDAQLEVGFRISGRVTDAVSGAGIGQVGVTINPASCCQEFLVKLTANDGSYTAVVRNGSYRIGFHPPFGSDYILQYWNG